jgi:hypothetical protein
MRRGSSYSLWQLAKQINNMSDVLVNDMFARIMESIQENMEHLQEHLQAIDERLSAVGRSRGSNRSRVGTIVDTSPHSVAHSVISWDPASTTDSLMSRDPSPSPATNHHIGSIRSQDSLHPPTVVLLLLLHSTMLAEVPREKQLLQGCVLPNGASSNEVWLASTAAKEGGLMMILVLIILCLVVSVER